MRSGRAETQPKTFSVLTTGTTEWPYVVTAHRGSNKLMQTQHSNQSSMQTQRDIWIDRGFTEVSRCAKR